MRSARVIRELSKLTVGASLAISRSRSSSTSESTPFEAEVQLQLPSEAMHSFHSTHNAVSWRLVLRGVPKRWPAFERVFPVVVFPVDGQGSNGENK